MMNEPCMCGDPACPSCGNPKEARLDTLTEDYCEQCGEWAREVYRELAKVSLEKAELSQELKRTTEELAEAKELMRELKKTLTEEYDGTFTRLDRVKAGMLHANYLARKALKFEGEPNTD